MQSIDFLSDPMNQTSLSHFQTTAQPSAAISRQGTLGERRGARTHININRQVDKHTRSEGERERETVVTQLHRLSKDFKNHLGLLSIFVKQVNQKAAAHEIQRGRRCSSVFM